MNKVYKFVNNLCGSNCYIITNHDNYLIIDPCVNKRDFEHVINNKKCVAIFLTHGHYDHFCNLEDFDYSEYKVYMHREALSKVNNIEHNYAKFFGKNNNININKEAVVFVKEGEIILNGFKIEIIETPGHSNCSICIKIAENLFSGDTLFKESVGRTDLFSSKPTDLNKSLYKLSKLSKKTLIFPGHEEETTLEHELSYNPFLIRCLKNV